MNHFFFYKFIVLGISIIIIFYSTKGIAVYPVYVLFLYLIGPYFDDAMQLRNTIALSFLYLSYKNLVIKKYKWMWVSLIFATLVHYLFAVFFIVFSLLRYGNKKIINMVFLFGIGAYVFIFFTHNFSFYTQIQNVIQLQKFSETVESSTNMGSLIALLFYIQLYLLTYFSDKMIQKVDSAVIVKTKYISGLIFDFVKLSSIFLPLCVITLSAMRFHRDIIILVLIEVLLLLSVQVINMRYRRCVVLGAFGSMCYFMYISNFFMGPPEDIIYSVLYGDPSWVLDLI